MTFDLKKASYTITLDDDPIIARIIEACVGVKTFSYATGKDLLQDIKEYNPMGVFVDIHLADAESGLEIIPTVKETWPDVPLIVITSDPENTLVAKALSAGADDFIRKPLEELEVRARLNARIAQLIERRGNSLLEFGDLKLDIIQKTLVGNKGRQVISNREVGLLSHLIKAKGMVMSKETLKRHLWGGAAISDNALDRKIYEVRKLLRDVTDNVELKSVYGEGLKLRLKSHDEEVLLLNDYDIRRKHRANANAATVRH